MRLATLQGLNFWLDAKIKNVGLNGQILGCATVPMLAEFAVTAALHKATDPDQGVLGSDGGWCGSLVGNCHLLQISFAGQS